MMLLGWDVSTWQRALAWASSGLSAIDMMDEGKLSAFADVRRRWLNAGGPIDAPSGKVLIDG